MKPRATGSYVTHWWRKSSPSGKHWWRNLHQVIRWSCKEFNATGRGGARILQVKCWTVFVPDLVKIPRTFKISRSTLRFGDKFTSDCLWASSWLTKGSWRVHQRMPMNIFSSTQDVRQSLQRQFENTDWTQRFIQYGNPAGLGTHFDSQELLCWVVQQQNFIRMEVYVFSDSTMCVGGLKSRSTH